VGDHYGRAVARSRESYARLLRGVGALLLAVGGAVLIVLSLTSARTTGSTSVDLVTGVCALVAGVLFGLPLIRSRRR
jgi:hypothetical protein